MNNEIKEVIEYHISNKMLITIERENIAPEEKLRGFPLKLTSEFVLMNLITDFHNEGFAIINFKDITDAYSKESDEFYERICKMEGLDKQNIPQGLLDISSFENLFEYLKQYDGLVSIQCIEQYEKGNFFLGKIMGIQNESVEIFEIGMDGKWDEKAEFIDFDEIIQISFADNYSKTYYKYADDFGSNN